MPGWKTLKSRQVFANCRFSVHEDDLLRPDKTSGKYYYTKSSPGVVIVPFDGKKIYLVNQYRYILKKRLWELPAGKAESSNYLTQAKKELREETGITAGHWKFLGTVASSPGSSNSLAKVYLATDLSFGPHCRELGERDMYSRAFSLSELDRMILAGKLFDSWALFSLHLFKLYWKKHL